MKTRKLARAFIAGSAMLLAAQCSGAGPLRDAIAGRERSEALDDGDGDGAEHSGPASLPAGVRVMRDVAYGSDRMQRFDVYLPRGSQGPHNAPVIFMLHGGGWARGDKAMRAVVANKVARWVPMGFVFVSANYRMLPEARPLDQAKDAAQALAVAQRMAASWGADSGRFIVMGHSAGAHLAALLAASPSLASAQGAQPWLGTVLLDSAALDVAQLMERRHLGLYERAFGSDPAYWRAASPVAGLAQPVSPLLAVCSTLRRQSCAQAAGFANRAATLGTRVRVLEQALSHREINERLGEQGAYTEAVESFLSSLDAAAAAALARR